MKTQIITLESHDDLISVRDKLSWAKTPRILLVWPKYEKVTLRVLDLKVLQRHADSLGAQLGLVTRRAKVRRDAESLGIPVFTSTTTAQRNLWTDSAPRSRRIPKAPRRDLRQVRDSVYEKEAAWRASLLGRILAFTAGVIAVLAMASLFVPRATLTLYPEAKTQSVVIPVSASESTQGVSITGLIPSQKISATVSAEQLLAITSEISVPKSKSKGVARFTNLSQGEVNIPAGTVVAAKPSTRFVTLNDTRLPAGVDQFVDVPIEALELGAQGNVAADTITIVEGSLGLSISVTNPNPLKGGANSQLIGATDADRAKLREVVMDNFRRDAESKLRAQIAPADILLMDTFEVAQIIEENFTPPAGQPGITLGLTMQVEFSAHYVLDDDLKKLSLSTLNASVENGFEATASPVYKVITDPSTDNSGVSHFDLEVTRTLLRQLDVLQVFSIVRGQKPESIKDELVSKLSLRKESEITITPSWWRWLPLIPFNISVTTH
ncbi:MAG: baseplate J/gp47 family protein [Anaerolineales bacterium]|nr:baseplate J/gp47 family protein [Anaerolineales bacterium]